MDGTSPSTSSSHSTLFLSSLSRPSTRVGDVDGIGNLLQSAEEEDADDCEQKRVHV